MEAYELDKEKIVDWATNYSSYEELEAVAKAVYAVFGERREKERPELHRQAKEYKKKKWAKKGGYRMSKIVHISEVETPLTKLIKEWESNNG